MTPRYVWMRPLLGLAAMGGFLFLTIKISVYGMKAMTKEAMFLFGNLTATIILLTKDCFAFYFGTSESQETASAETPAIPTVYVDTEDRADLGDTQV